MNKTTTIIADEEGYKQRCITLQPKAKNGVIHFNEIKKFVNKLSDEAEKKGIRMYVRGRNMLRNTTIKSLSDPVIQDYNDEYLKNIGDPEKFHTFYNVQIILIEGNREPANRRNMFLKKR